MASREDILTNKVFLCAVLPLIKTIAMDDPKLAKKFEHAHAVIQVSAKDPDAPAGKYATHFVVNSGVAKKPAVFAAFMMTLLKMSSLLTAKEPPQDEETKKLLVKCYFYLLSSGISTLNKQGHEDIHNWALKSPDRVYAWAVDGYPEISAYIRIKAGKSKAGRGVYKRALPFFTMRFDSLDSALGILMGTADMLDYTKDSKLIMDGAPEFGAQIGTYMMTVAGYAQ